MQPVIPNPLESEEQYRRFWHQDLPALSDVRLWAEEDIIKWELQRLVCRDEPRRQVWDGQLGCPPHAGIINEEGWLSERLSLIRAEQDKRLQ